MPGFMFTCTNITTNIRKQIQTLSNVDYFFKHQWGPIFCSIAFDFSIPGNLRLRDYHNEPSHAISLYGERLRELNRMIIYSLQSFGRHKNFAQILAPWRCVFCYKSSNTPKYWVLWGTDNIQRWIFVHACATIREVIVHGFFSFMNKGKMVSIAIPERAANICDYSVLKAEICEVFFKNMKLCVLFIKHTEIQCATRLEIYVIY